MKYDFVPEVSLHDGELSRLSEAVLDSHASPIFYRSIPALANSVSVKLCGLTINDTLVAFAWYMPRMLSTLESGCLAVSIGVVTTVEGWRKKGLASILMEEIIGLCREMNATCIYLQGIPNFYLRFGFSGFASKSKFIFSTDDFPCRDPCSVRSMKIHDLEVVSSLYNQYSSTIGGLCRRSPSDWIDLLTNLSSTFLFFDPQVIEDRNGTILGYFCTSPESHYSIREFVTSVDPRLAYLSLCSVASLQKMHGQRGFEIFAPDVGPVAEVANFTSGADFMRLVRPNGSNMIKILDNSIKLDEPQHYFIFQGDNL
jgi:hypothetical protein